METRQGHGLPALAMKAITRMKVTSEVITAFWKFRKEIVGEQELAN